MSAGAFQSIDQLAQWARRWIAVEELLFETLGRWARELPDPSIKRLFGTWCHRHAWHAELWRDRLPAVDWLADTGDDVDAWIEPLRAALADVRTSEEAIAALASRCCRLWKPLWASTATRSIPCSTDRRLACSTSSAPTSPPRLECFLLMECYVSSSPARDTPMGRGQTWTASARGGGQRPSRLYAHHSNGLR